MKRQMMLLGLVSALVVAVPHSAVAGALPHGKPTIAITAPKSGVTVHGSTVTVHVAVKNFRLVRPILLSPSKWGTIPLLKGNQGHIHYFLDSMAAMVLTRDVTTQTTHTWTHVTPGRHTVTAYLATSQHAPFPGAKPAKVTVMVAPSHAAKRTTAAAPKPAIRILGVRMGSSAQGMVVNVRVAVSHFKLVRPVYVNPPKLAGDQGHVHYVLDSLSNFSAERDATTALNHPWTHVKPGRHTLIAYLATSQHQPFPGVKPAAVQINVPASASHGVTLTAKLLPVTGGAQARQHVLVSWAELCLGGIMVLVLGLLLAVPRRRDAAG